MTRIAMEIPKVGLVMESVRVTRWLKNVGDTVTQGEPLVEVETEKSIVEIEASVSGRLAEILVPVDHEATVGDPIAWFESDAPAVASAPPAKTPKVERAESRPSAVTNKPPAGDRIVSSPAARKLAAEHGIDLAGLSGSGPNGRIQLEDVQRAIESPATAEVPAGAQRLTPMRRALARAMTLSNATVPQFFVERAVDWTAILALRADFSAKLPQDSPKLSVNDFLLQAVARALIEFPALNATFSGDPDSPDARIVEASGAHIGLVVAVEGGLLVPVIHGVEKLGLVELARQRVECVGRALQGRLKREELSGATFSISNLGAGGPDRFTAIINPPQSAILAVGRQRDQVVARNGKPEVRPQSELTLTVDHRVADGRVASEFLGRLVNILEGREWRLT